MYEKPCREGFVRLLCMIFSDCKAADACQKEQKNACKHKEIAEGQKEKPFVQKALRIQIFWGDCLPDQAENAEKQSDACNGNKMRGKPIPFGAFALLRYRVHVAVPFYHTKLYFLRIVYLLREEESRGKYLRFSYKFL